MNSANIVRCLSELFNVHLRLNITEISQKERLVAQLLAEIISSFTNCNQFHYDDVVTLDLANDSDDYYNKGGIVDYARCLRLFHIQVLLKKKE